MVLEQDSDMTSPCFRELSLEAGRGLQMSLEAGRWVKRPKQ